MYPPLFFRVAPPCSSDAISECAGGRAACVPTRRPSRCRARTSYHRPARRARVGFRRGLPFAPGPRSFRQRYLQLVAARELSFFINSGPRPEFHPGGPGKRLPMRWWRIGGGGFFKRTRTREKKGSPRGLPFWSAKLISAWSRCACRKSPHPCPRAG